MKEKFIQFLISHNCLDEFKANLRDGDRDFDYHLNRTWLAGFNWVTSAFNWATTTQGHEYWDKIHREWHKMTHNSFS